MESVYVIPKLSYEILNTPVVEIADSIGLSPKMLNKVIEDRGWVRKFPDDEDISINATFNPSGSVDMELLEGEAGEDIFTVKADQFLDRTRKRIQLFNVAKTLALTEGYATLEHRLMDRAITAADELTSVDVAQIKELAVVFKTLAKDLNSAAGIASFAQDESGLPTVILRDLSGS